MAQRSTPSGTTSTSPAPASLKTGLDWRCQRLDDLRPLALHRILQARQQVFVVEQNCVYLDADAADEASWHLAAWAPDLQLMAYARIVDPGVKYDEASIGRVITPLTSRGTGLGRELVRRAISHARHCYPEIALRISAQSRLQRFYAEFGFVAVGEPYLEDGIAHREMLRAGT